MLQFFLNGGFPMWIILLVGLVAMLTAIRFAWRPTADLLGQLKALTRALGYAIMAATVADLITVCTRVPADPEMSREPALYVLQGIGESLSPVALGASFLFFTWILIALGLRRLARDAVTPAAA